MFRRKSVVVQKSLYSVGNLPKLCTHNGPFLSSALFDPSFIGMPEQATNGG